MGKSVTPTYRIEIWDNNNRTFPIKMVWEGRVSEKILANYIKKYIDSLKMGGANYHISESLGFIPVPYKAVVVKQKTREVVAVWNAPMFMEI